MSIMFANFSMPSSEIPNPLSMELSLENKTFKFIYPQQDPLNITLSPKFIHETITLTLFAINHKDKKNKILSRGNIILHKAIFSDKKERFEKQITMIPLDKLKDMKKAGKITIIIDLLDNLEEWQKNLKNFGKKNSFSKVNKLSSASLDKEKEFIISHKKQFDDNISNISEENIYDDEDDDDYEKKKEFLDINNFISSKEYITHLKQKFEDDYQKILPKDFDKLKEYNKNLYQKFFDLSNKYNEILKTINENNDKTKNKAIEYWNDYKNVKKDLYKKRLELKKLKKNLDKENTQNKKDNDYFYKNIQKITDEKEVFLKTLMNKDGDYDASNLVKITSGNDNNNITMLTNLIKKFASLGFNLSDGLNVSEEEKKILSVLTGVSFENFSSNQGNSGANAGSNSHMKEDISLSNKIVALIERDVNDLYGRKYIKEVTINQIDVTTYSFADKIKTKKISFNIKDNELVCTSGESFTSWLVTNFGQQ